MQIWTKFSSAHRCKVSRLLAISITLLFLQQFCAAAPYDFIVIAGMGDPRAFPGFKQEVSVNDSGQVAFAPYDWHHFPSFGSLWVGDEANTQVYLDGSPSINYVQINNTGQVVACLRAQR